jgi:hypothetical protein
MITEATIILLAVTGWDPSGHRWATSDLPVPYCITANGTNTNLTATQQRNALTAAVDAWRAGVGVTCTSYNAVAQPSNQCNPVQNSNDGQNNIFWENNWQQGSGTIGVTWSVFFGNCGTVTDDLGTNHNIQCSIDADIELNDVHFFWDNTGADTDVQSIATHEYGHFLGLGHCDDNNTCQAGSGVMNSFYGGGQIRVPFNDDIQGVCALYPGTPGGLGWPCTNNNQCTNNICINPGTSGYCSQTCGTCLAGYTCEPNPQNAAQMVCLRDDGTNQDVCETCAGDFACANNGACFTNLPEPNQGRCMQHCPNPADPRGGCPVNFDCYQVQTDNFCFPLSSDCTDLTNFQELQLGQPCNGNPPCAQGLECIGICSEACTGSPGQGTCDPGYGCEPFAGQQGTEYWCAPGVNEGQSCRGLQACLTGPCLSQNGNYICFRECTGNPSACNNAQTCNDYTIGGRPRSICEPPGVPPRIDAGVPDFGMIDAGCGCDDDNNACDPGCSCDPLCTAEDAAIQEPDGGVPGGQDADVMPGQDAGMTPDPCLCDQTFGCDPGCNQCDPECGECTCDETFECDRGCEDCDPECSGARSGCSGCTAAAPKGGFTSSLYWALGFLALISSLLGSRRFVR